MVYDPVVNCQKDDTYSFGTDGILTIQQGAEKCNSNEPLARSVPYSYDRSIRTLVIDGFTYTMAQESGNQIKYYADIASATGYTALIFLLE